MSAGLASVCEHMYARARTHAVLSGVMITALEVQKSELGKERWLAKVS